MNPGIIREKLSLLRRTYGAARRVAAAPLPELAAPLDELALAAFEAEHRIMLPQDYRLFLLEVGNGGPGPGYGLSPLAPWHMDGFARVVVTVTGHGGTSATAGTGDRPPTARPSDPSRPFPLTARWTPFGKRATPWPLPCDANPYDGCLHLAEIGCGYFYFLVVTGRDAGQVWHDYTAGDGEIGPTGDTFGQWYERWLDATLVDWVRGFVITEMDRDPGWSPLPDALNVIQLGEKLALEDRPDRLEWLGCVRLYLRQTDDAARWFSLLASVAPDDVRADVGMCRVRLLQGDGKRSLAAADAGLARETIDFRDETTLHRLRARALRMLGRLDEAILAAREARESAYGLIDGYFELAAMQIEAGDQEAAATTLAEAKEGSRCWAGSGEAIHGEQVGAAFAELCARRGLHTSAQFPMADRLTEE